MILTKFLRERGHKNLRYITSQLYIPSHKLLRGRVFSIRKLISIYLLLIYSSHSLIVLAKEFSTRQNKDYNSTTGDQKMIKTSSSTSDTTQNRIQIQPIDIDKKSFRNKFRHLNSHESPAPSTLSSIYDYINSRKQQEKQPTKASSTIQPSNFQQFVLNDIRPQGYDHQRAVALGRENDQMLSPKQPQQLDEPELIQPFLVEPVDGNTLPSSINYIPKKHLYNKPVALQSTEEHILSAHPMNNNIDSHHLTQMIKMMPAHGNNKRGIHANTHNLGQQMFKSHEEDVYEAEKNPYKQSLRQNFYQNSQKPPYLDKKRFSPLLKEQRIIPPHQSKIYSPEAIKLEKRQKLLSNDQLVSLIDELKEFNSHQASKMQVGGFVSPMAGNAHRVLPPERLIRHTSDGKSQPESYSRLLGVHHSGRAYPKTSPMNKIRKTIQSTGSEVESESNSNETEDLPDMLDLDEIDERKRKKGSEIHPNRTNKMNTNDLAKFAQFLITKEGSNMKFQLDLDKETPDDGDEVDERDALLESKEKQTKTKPRRMSTHELMNLDKKQREASKNMDKLMNVAQESIKVAEKEFTNRGRVKKGDMKNKQHKLVNNNDSNERARKRRDREGSMTGGSGDVDGDHDSKDSAYEIPANEQEKIREEDSGGNVGGGLPRSNPKEANFAKLLIKQEILEDQRDSVQDPPTSSSKRVEKSGKGKSDYNHHQLDSGRVKLAGDVIAESSLPKSEFGEEEDHYPAKDRIHDHKDLMGELQKARLTKSKTRSRIPMPVDSLLKRALDGELGLRTERGSNGKLLLKDTVNKDNVAVLELPKKSGSEEFVKSTEDDGSLNSELIPAQINPDHHQDGGSHQGSNNIMVQSSKPVKDEYPISERVSAGLNKLSNNLDRYFNDGFLAEIETKSKDGINNGNNNHRYQHKNHKESHQPESSNLNEAARQVLVDEIQKGANRGLDTKDDEPETKIKGKVDHDFDVDVGIDGKKDNDKDEDESDKDIGDDNEKSNPKRKKFRVKKKMVNRTHNEPIKRGDFTSNGNKKGKALKELSKNNKGKVEKGPPIDDNVDDNKSVKRDMTATSEKVEFENHGRMAPNLDPVESENLETPIGPDSDNVEGANISSQEKTKSTEGTEIKAKYGKKVDGKFYEEPEWR